VAVLAPARLLVLLTEVEGVYSRAPGSPDAELVAEGERAGEAALGEGSPLGRGGMGSKVLAAQLAAAAGIPTVIAGGEGESVLGPILAGERRGTRFTASGSGESAFKLWLRYCKRPVGRLIVDEGARRAVLRDGASLLAAGVIRAEGHFAPGDAVELAGEDGSSFAKGIAGAPASELAARRKGVEAVHRDRLVLL
ncbi:MAG: glutamate 5-kinase, partial [Actinomycetota bacterium]|nr:glutamate 5-kinase [Actinomycetota bacterium]